MIGFASGRFRGHLGSGLRRLIRKGGTIRSPATFLLNKRPKSKGADLQSTVLRRARKGIVIVSGRKLGTTNR